jgi:hypothetical protein
MPCDKDICDKDVVDKDIIEKLKKEKKELKLRLIESNNQLIEKNNQRMLDLNKITHLLRMMSGKDLKSVDWLKK